VKLTLDKPLQIRIQEAIIDMIRDEKLIPGDQLPTESELYRRFGVGRSTVRESLANLVQQGVLFKMQGKGTFIRTVPVRVKNGLDQLFSVSENIKAVGAVPSTSRINVKTIPAGELSDKLNIGEKEPCVWVERVRRANDEIAAYCIDIIPRSIISDNIEEIDYKGSLFDLLYQNGHIVSHSESTLRPTMLAKRDFPEMKDSVGLFLLLEEIYYNISGNPVCYSNDYYSSNVFDFKIIRKRQLG
jgi:GntR family transcriptional regulator|tara:strand:+ start:116 stop:844 length:729 start_codon:yes stop_codon:yes gene_type:complete